MSNLHIITPVHLFISIHLLRGNTSCVPSLVPPIKITPVYSLGRLAATTEVQASLGGQRPAAETRLHRTLHCPYHPGCAGVAALNGSPLP